MTDLPSVKLKFITESDAMETQMDMVEPMPETMSLAVFSSLRKFMETAVLHCNRMVEALSIIEAVHKDAMDINNFNTMKSRKDELVQRFRHLNHALLGKAPTAPSRSTSVSDPKNGNISNLSIITCMGPPTIQPAEAKTQIVVQP